MKILYTNALDEIIVSDEDFVFLQEYTWCLDGKGYPCRNKSGGGMEYLHQIVLGAPPAKGLSIDHVDRNPLNNQRDNLRWASQTLQNINQKVRSDNSCGVRGVDFSKRNGWRARIQVHGTVKNLGWFKTFDQAVAARRKAEAIYFLPIIKGATG